MKTQSVQEISTKITRSKAHQSRYQTIYENKSCSGKNEFLLFIKPEITMMADKSAYEKIINFIIKKIDLYDLNITNIKTISSDYLKAHQIIAKHYSTINKASNNAKKHITENGIECFETEFNTDFETSTVLGAHEFLRKSPFISPQSLDMIWANMKSVKLCEGIYCIQLNYQDDEIFLVNGFHPMQLEHFEKENRFIITISLEGNIDWKTARTALIGSTNPQKAQEGSIRNTLYIKRDKLGLKCVNSNWNGVHLSAGPIEGLNELIRFNTNYDFAQESQPFNYQTGRDLISNFGIELTETIIKNPVIRFNGVESSVYDLTQNKNSDECIELLKEAYQQKLSPDFV